MRPPLARSALTPALVLAASLAACRSASTSAAPSRAAAAASTEPASETRAADRESAAGSEGGGNDAGDESDWRGSASLRYRGRRSGSDDDQDLHHVLALDRGDARTDSWSASFLGTARLDLDGSEGGSSYPSLADTFDGSLTGEVWHAYVDLNQIDGIERVRLGRQFDREGPELAWFDGASLETSPLGKRRTSFGVYGGLPVHTFESSSSGDFLVGGFGETHPWKGARARLDWFRVEDETRTFLHENDLVSGALWQTVGKSAHAELRYSRLDGHDRDRDLRLQWIAPDGKTVLRATYHELLRTQSQLVIEFDPYFESLQELRPYRQLGFLATRALDERRSIDLGFDLRRLDDDGDEGTSNREWERAWAALSWKRLILGKIDATVFGERWDSGSAATAAWGLDLAREFSEQWEASLGSHFALYEYDAWLDRDHIDVRSWNLRLRYRPKKSRTFELRYELTDDEEATWHTLRLGATWRF